MICDSKQRLKRIRDVINSNVEPEIVRHWDKYYVKRGYEVFSKSRLRWVPFFEIKSEADYSDILLSVSNR